MKQNVSAGFQVQLVDVLQCKFQDTFMMMMSFSSPLITGTSERTDKSLEFTFCSKFPKSELIDRLATWLYYVCKCYYDLTDIYQ